VAAREKPPTGHAHNARLNAVILEPLQRFHTEGYFGTGSDQNDIRLAALGFRQYVGTVARTRIDSVAAIEVWNILAREREERRAVVLYGEGPCLGRFVSVGGTNHDQARNRTQTGQV